MTVEMTATEEYLHLIEKLKLENGISYKILAEKSGVKEHKVKAIRGGNSSADIVMVRKLKSAYADVLGIEQEKKDERQQRITELLEETNRLLKENAQLVRTSKDFEIENLKLKMQLEKLKAELRRYE